MKNFSITKKVFLCIVLLALEVVMYVCADRVIMEVKRNRIYTTSNEFLQTIDCAGIFNANPDENFIIEFDIRAEKPGRVLVYQQGGSTARYAFYEYVNVTQEYQTMQIVVHPILIDEKVESSILAFYGEYGTGVIPEVKNLSIIVKEDDENE